MSTADVAEVGISAPRSSHASPQRGETSGRQGVVGVRWSVMNRTTTARTITTATTAVAVAFVDTFVTDIR